MWKERKKERNRKKKGTRRKKKMNYCGAARIIS